MKDKVSNDLWREYARTRSAPCREALIRQYAPLARRAVDRLQISPWGCVSKDDLIGHAVVGLIEAVDRFDPSLGIPFEGFAMPRIRGAVLDSLRQLDWAPRSVRRTTATLRNVMNELDGRLGRPPTDDEIAAELGITRDQLDHMYTDLARGSILSLDELVAGTDECISLGDQIPAGAEEDPFLRQVQREARQSLQQALEALPEREQLVVSLYYHHDLTLKEIGKILQVTEQRVSQLHAKAVLRLSRKLIRQTHLVPALRAS